MHLALASETLNDGVITALKAAGCSMTAKNSMGLSCADVEDLRKEVAADIAAKEEKMREEVKEKKEKKKEERLAELRDFLETEAELDASSIDALVNTGHVGSMDALVKLCDSDDRLLKLMKTPKAAKRLQAAVRCSLCRHHAMRVVIPVQVRRYIKGDSSDEEAAGPVAQAKSSGLGRSIACVPAANPFLSRPQYAIQVHHLGRHVAIQVIAKAAPAFAAPQRRSRATLHPVPSSRFPL